MTLEVIAYTESAGPVPRMKVEIPKVENWERVLRKMDAWIWNHSNQKDIIELFCFMTDETGCHDMTQAWALEYSQHYPNWELPFI